MEPHSEPYVIGGDYVVRSAEELGFSPRAGYSFVCWTGPDGTRYEPGRTIRISDGEFALSATWRPSRAATVIRLTGAESVSIHHAASSSGGKISVDVGEEG